MGTTKTRTLNIRTTSGVVVDGIATVPCQAEAANVFAHGVDADMADPFMTAVAEGLAQRQIGTLRYQFPYMQAGKSRVDAPAVAHEPVRAAVAKANTMWSSLPLFAGGKSVGGPMTSQAQAISPLPGVLGLAFLGSPLHRVGKPAVDRVEHLSSVSASTLFIPGMRDALA